jgi:purine-binding chemotaxis protein CheW
MREKQVEVQEETRQLVIFRLGNEEFGVDILQAKEIERMIHEVTRVPRAPTFVEGVINLRGDIIPIVDLRKRFNMGDISIAPETRIIIVEIEGGLVGMVVDAVLEVSRIPVSAIEAAPSITRGVDAYFLSGVANVEERLIILLNLERVLTVEEVQELVKATGEEPWAGNRPVASEEPKTEE